MTRGPTPAGLSRRRWLAVVASAPAVALIAAAPDTLQRRKGTFTYNRRDLKLRIAIPDILRSTDKQAMKMLDGGYPTRLVYDFAVYAKGARAPRSTAHVEVSVQYDPWNKNYLVQTSVNGAAATVRSFALRADAIKASTHVSVAVAKLADMPRGADQVHYVHAVAQRNPTQSKSGGNTGAARGQDRDLEVFSRWVGMFVRSRPKADQIVEFRTHPFYVPVEGEG